MDLGVLSRDAAASGALKLEPGVNPSHALTSSVVEKLVTLDVTGCGECRVIWSQGRVRVSVIEKLVTLDVTGCGECRVIWS